MLGQSDSRGFQVNDRVMSKPPRWRLLPFSSLSWCLVKGYVHVGWTSLSWCELIFYLFQKHDLDSHVWEIILSLREESAMISSENFHPAWHTKVIGKWLPGWHSGIFWMPFPILASSFCHWTYRGLQSLICLIVCFLFLKSAVTQWHRQQRFMSCWFVND